jgi:hypothetical protein
MPDTPPDHLSNNPRSPFFQEDVLKRDIGVRFNGVEKTNVEEYCVSESWIRVEVGKTKDRYGNPMTIKLTGKVEPYFKDKKSDEKPAEPAPAEPAKAEKPAAAAKPQKPKQGEKAEKSAKANKSAKPAKTNKAGAKKKKK